MAAGTTSAAHVLALLDEEEDSLKLYALQQLDKSVDDFWFQISSSIAAIEALYEDEEFSHRELAALVASKVRDRGPFPANGFHGRSWHRPCVRAAEPPASAGPGVAAAATEPCRMACRSSTTWAIWTMR